MRSLILLLISTSTLAAISGCGGRKEPPAAFSYGTSSPRDKTYRKIVIQPGQSLAFVARKYDVQEEAILSLNNLPEDAVLRVGQEIYLPKASARPKQKKIVRLTSNTAQNAIETTALEPLEPLTSPKPTLSQDLEDDWVDVIHKGEAKKGPSSVATDLKKTESSALETETRLKNAQKEKKNNDDFFDTYRDEAIEAELKSLKKKDSAASTPSSQRSKTEQEMHPTKGMDATERDSQRVENSEDDSSEIAASNHPVTKDETPSLTQDKHVLVAPKGAKPVTSTTQPASKDESKETSSTPLSEAPTSPHHADSASSSNEPSSDLTSGADSSNFAWPLPFKGEITLSFNQVINGAKNDGININVPRGTPVQAIAEGIIVHASPVKGFGNLILIKHNDTWMSAYGHLDKILIKQGTKIQKGQKIGTVGQTGYVKTPQLHFELRQSSKPVDPMQHIKP